MREEFYDFVKSEIKKIPNSSSICLHSIGLKEDDFLLYVNNKYHLEFLNFNQNLSYESVDGWPPDLNKDKILRDSISYHYKINNQMYLEYIVMCHDLKKNYPYMLEDLTVYSNDINRTELISFIMYINEYLKNK